MFTRLRWLWFNLAYFKQPPWDTGVSPPELLQFVGSHPPGRALDLGCGTGTNLLTLASYGWQVSGIDYAWRAVQIARKRLKQSGATGYVTAGDVTMAKHIRGQFDLVLDMGCYHGISKTRRSAYRANLLRWLAMGGTFLMYAHCLELNGQVGIDDMDIEGFCRMLNIRERLDSIDSRGRPAVWLRFEK
jgi:SAM-dependent methyltransferase